MPEKLLSVSTPTEIPFRLPESFDPESFDPELSAPVEVPVFADCVRAERDPDEEDDLSEQDAMAIRQHTITARIKRKDKTRFI